MRLIHLSDFHLTSDTLDDLETYILNPLIKDLKKAHGEKKIDFIMFTGDLVDKGGASFGSLEVGLLEFESRVIEFLVNELKLPKDRFIIIPGNHDIDRNADLKSSELGLRSQLIDLDSVNNFLKDDREFKGSTKRILKFKEFEESLYESSTSSEVTYLESIHKHSIDNVNVGIAALNSVWRCFESKEDSGRLLVGEKQLMDAISKVEGTDVKIALLHHPFDELASFEKRIIRDRMTNNFDLILTGHVHREDGYKFSNMSGSTIISAAPSSWTGNIRSNNSQYLNGYTIIDLNKNEGCKLSYRRYSHGKMKFIPNNDIGNDIGEEYYQFPTGEQLVNRNKAKEIIENINRIHCASLDEHLLTFNTDTNAPKKINDLFVLPKLVNKDEDTVEDNLTEVVEKTYTIQQICEADDNLILLGVKESGKTILLDKILMEFTNRYENYNKIPVYVNFEDINGSEIDTIISKYINVGIKDIRNGDFLIDNLILLIDNIKFEEQYRKISDKLFAFFENNKSVKFIATCTSNGEEEIPIEAIDEPLFQIMKVIYVKQFNTREIKELMLKWFSGKVDFIGKKENLEKVIKTFTALNLPRTPLAVSMFLWIIEKQENYAPVNNAQMLENFLERLFSKADTYAVYSANFTYKNKEALLTDIAYKMYEENKSHYKLSYGELRDFIENSLKEKMFDFDVDVILEHFINKGIFSIELIDTVKYVRFKFGCFFQFYLMKNFDKNPEFKNFVLNNGNYLNFVDELDYYTGLKMDDVELVELIINGMNKAFNNINNQFATLPLGIDTLFETVHTIVSTIDNEKLNDITEELKETEEDYYHSKDLELEKHQSKNMERKSENLSPIQKLERHWVLAGKILKNSEEITKKDLKLTAFKAVIKSSMSFAALYKAFLIKKKSDKKDDLDEQFYILYKLLPLLHQVILTQTLGTAKLNLVVEQIIESEEFEKYSDLERFVYVFLYADLNGKKKFDYMNTFLKNYRTHYIKDMIFLKNLEYYYRQDTSSVDELKYKNILGDIVEENNSNGSKKRPLNKKGIFISKIEKEKLDRSLKSLEDLAEVK